MAFIFTLSRKRRFRCERCGELFNSHTISTRVWLALWVLFWVALALGIIGVVISGEKW